MQPAWWRGPPAAADGSFGVPRPREPALSVNKRRDLQVHGPRARDRAGGVKVACMFEQQLASLNQQVIEAYRAGQYQQAIDLATQACDLVRRQCGPNHPDVAAILTDIGNMYRAADNPAGAEP